MLGFEQGERLRRIPLGKNGPSQPARRSVSNLVLFPFLPLRGYWAVWRSRTSFIPLISWPVLSRSNREREALVAVEGAGEELYGLYYHLVAISFLSRLGALCRGNRPP